MRAGTLGDASFPAAKDLLSGAPGAFSGNHRDIRASDLMKLKSYPLVMKQLFADLGIP